MDEDSLEVPAADTVSLAAAAAAAALATAAFAAASMIEETPL